MNLAERVSLANGWGHYSKFFRPSDRSYGASSPPLVTPGEGNSVVLSLIQSVPLTRPIPPQTLAEMGFVHERHTQSA